MEPNLSYFDSWNSSEQVTRLDDQLPEVIKYEGEFGAEIVNFLPFIYNLHLRGLLENRKVSTYSGMKPYYYFLGRQKIIERKENRFWIPQAERWWPNSNEHHRVPTSGELYPSFERSLKGAEVLFIQNKFCIEWDEGPINFLSIDLLHQIFEKTKGRFNVVYSRQGILSNDSALGISIDHNKELNFDDLELCEKYPHVMVLEKRRFGDLRPYNSRKLHWINKAFLLAGVQGGSNYPWAYLKKDALILHKRGRETEFSYENGFYRYLSNPPLALKVVNNDEMFLKEILNYNENH
jgi:hypothetical protein